jgi:hypothetical protein
LTKPQIYFLGWAKNSAGISANSADASATTVQNIDSPDISLNDVSFTSMTVHMETVYAADKNVTSFDVSWNPTTPWIVRTPRMSTSRTDEATEYTFYGWAEIPQESAKLADASNHNTEYPRCPIFRSTTCLYFHDVHMETVYAADKNVTSFDVSGTP